MDDLEPLTEAERKLLEAVETGGLCDLSHDDETDRTVRAAVLKAILSGDGEAWGIGAGAAINLRGAVVSGDLRGFHGSRLPPIRLESCRFDGEVNFSGATFTGDAKFERVTFTGAAAFVRATFNENSVFEGATFTGNAHFGEVTFPSDAHFDEAVFSGGAVFSGAMFSGTAWFWWASFSGDTTFGKATFTDTAVFPDTTFTGDTQFNYATFSSLAWFTDAIFTDTACFNGATFTGDARFEKATFTGDAWFDEATFTGDAKFDRALAHRLRFSRAVFSAADPGPWIASSISLDRTSLAVRSRISITANEIHATRLQAGEGAHLMLHCASVDLSDSEFLRRSIVSSPPLADRIPPCIEITTGQEARTATAAEASSPAVAERTPPNSLVMPDEVIPPRLEARAAAIGAAKNFRDDLESELAGIPPRCRLTSLARANIGELVLSDVVLDDCAFAGAHGLDKLRIGARCSFQQTERWWKRRRNAADRLPGWPMVRRSVIAEELQWRAAHRHRDKTTDREFLPSALGIAGIYRDLRKGLEDAKNEPGAADFYYGEMEMRRLAGRKPPEAGRQPADAASKSPGPSWPERLLLYGYWAVSGYGLRASRALLTLIAVVGGAAFLYTKPAFATVTPPPAQILMINPASGAVTYTPPIERTAPGFWTALEYSARESISLLQARSMPAIDTTGVGTLLDFLLRLAGPVLLAFAILALRARTKR